MRLSDLPQAVGHDEFGTRRVKPKTIQIYESACNKLIQYLGDVEFEGVTGSDLLKFHEWLRDGAGVAVSTANTYRRTLRAVFNYLGRPELGRPLKKLKGPPPRNKAMEDDTFARMMMYAGLRDAALIMFLAMSGARRATVCNLRKRDMQIVMGEDGRFMLMAEVLTKDDATALCLGTHDAALLMLAWLAIQPNSEATEYVFTTPEGQPMAPQSINSIFRGLKKKAKLPPSAVTNPHSLRHRFAHNKLDGGHDIASVSGYLNHSSPVVTMEIYAHRTRDKLIETFFKVKAIK